MAGTIVNLDQIEAKARECRVDYRGGGEFWVESPTSGALYRIMVDGSPDTGFTARCNCKWGQFHGITVLGDESVMCSHLTAVDRFIGYAMEMGFGVDDLPAWSDEEEIEW